MMFKTREKERAEFEGIIPVNKPKGMTAFHLVRLLRKHLGVRKIGHAGTLDPFAEGVMVMLVGRKFTRLSDTFLTQDKEYLGTVHLGVATDTYDCEGEVVGRSDSVPDILQIGDAVKCFQGKIRQVPPMFSAKKVNGQKLYELARKGKVIERQPAEVTVDLEVLAYDYPELKIRVRCSKGTYIRSLAHDLGEKLGCGAHLSSLVRTKSGSFHLDDCLEGTKLQAESFNPEQLKQITRFEAPEEPNSR